MGDGGGQTHIERFLKKRCGLFLLVGLHEHDLGNRTRDKNYRVSSPVWITCHNTNLFLKMGLVLVLGYSARDFILPSE